MKVVGPGPPVLVMCGRAACPTDPSLLLPRTKSGGLKPENESASQEHWRRNPKKITRWGGGGGTGSRTTSSSPGGRRGRDGCVCSDCTNRSDLPKCLSLTGQFTAICFSVWMKERKLRCHDET